MNPVADFLAWLFPDGVDGAALYVSTRDRIGGGNGVWRDREVMNLEAAEALIRGSRETCDVYVTTALFERGRDRKAEHARSKSVISLDVDTKGMPGETPADRMQKAWELASSLDMPSVIVCTGGGYHVHVRLPDGDRLQDFPVADGRERVEILGRALRLYAISVGQRLFNREVDLDGIHDTPRVVRVPGTWNLKPDGAAVTKGDVTGRRQVYVARPQEPGALLATPAAQLDLLGPFLEEAGAQQQAGRGSSCAAPTVFATSAIIPESLKAQWPMGDGDQSETDWAVARACAEQGLPASTARAAVRARRALLSSPEDRAKAEREDYVSGTVTKAYAADAEDAALHPAADGGPVDTPQRALSFVPIDQLTSGSGPSVPWLWDGVIARGGIHLLTGKPKEAGKSTLVIALIAALAEGKPFLGRATLRTEAILVSEERAMSLSMKALQYGMRTTLCLPSSERGRVPWDQVIQLATQRALVDGRGLLVIDTFAAWAALKDDSENSSSAILRALAPLRDAANAGLTVLLTHHARKGESSLADAPRGSTALAGEVDVLMQLGKAARAPDMRQLEVVGRYASEPVAIVYGVGPQGVFLASAELAGDAARERLLAPLRGAPEGLSSKQWEKVVRMNREAFQHCKKLCVEEGLVREVPGKDKRQRLFVLAEQQESTGVERGDAVPPLTGENRVPPSPLLPVEDEVPSRGTGSDCPAGANSVPGSGTGTGTPDRTE